METQNCFDLKSAYGSNGALAFKKKKKNNCLRMIGKKRSSLHLGALEAVNIKTIKPL